MPVAHVLLSFNIMKILGRHIFFLLAMTIFLLGGFNAAHAADENPSEAELQFVAWINEARENPLSVATAMGMDTEKILAELPKLHDILINGIDPLGSDMRLFKAARSHAEDMLERSYYSSVSPEGSTLEDRLFAHHYFPVTAGESLGMLAFVNYMESEKAARLMFEDIFTKELSPDSVKRNILNPDVKHVAVGMHAGLIRLEHSSVNVYIAVCDFASDDTSFIEVAIADWFNNDREEWKSGQLDLFWTDDLYSVAKKHIHDMEKRVYFSNISPEGKGPLDRAYAENYYAVSLYEILGGMVLSDSFVAPADAAELLYEKLLEREPGFFKRNDSHIGVAFDGVIFDLGGGAVLKAYMMIIESATDTGIFSPMVPEEKYNNFIIYSNK